MRSSRVSSPSRIALRSVNRLPSSFMCHSSMVLSCEQLGLGFPVVGEVVIAVADVHAVEFDDGRAHAVEHERDGARVESVSKARRARSYMSFTLSMYSAGLAGSRGMGALTAGLGLFSQPRDTCMRCSRSRTLVKYWSSRSRSRAGTLPLEFLGLAGDGVEDAPAGVELPDLRVDLVGRALEEQLLEDVGRLVLGRDRDAGARPGEAARAAC